MLNISNLSFPKKAKICGGKRTHRHAYIYIYIYILFIFIYLHIAKDSQKLHPPLSKKQYTVHPLQKEQYTIDSQNSRILRSRNSQKIGPPPKINPRTPQCSPQTTKMCTVAIRIARWVFPPFFFLLPMFLEPSRSSSCMGLLPSLRPRRFPPLRGRPTW